MLSIRIIATGAALAAAVAAASSLGASAQTGQPAATPGKPIQLLQIDERSNKTSKPKTHVKTAAKAHHKHLAAKVSHQVPPPAKEPQVTDITAVPAIDPPVNPAIAFAEPMPNVVTVAGQSVQVAAPDDVNDIDCAADTPDKLVRNNVAADAATATAEAVTSSPTVVTSASQDHASTTSGRATWFAEALASLGGAIAAASAAWFLIGSTPQRLHG